MIRVALRDSRANGIFLGQSMKPPAADRSEFGLKLFRGAHALSAAMSDETTLPPGSEILLLEDDAPFRKRLAGYLRQLGAEVTEAACIAEARRLLHELRF